MRSFLLVLPMFILSPPARAQFAYIRPACFYTPAWVKKIEATSSTNNATVAATFTGSVTKDNLVICEFDYASSTTNITGVTDSKGNAWTKAAGPARIGGWTSYMYYAIAATGGSSFTVTATLSTSNNNKLINCHEYSGVATNSPLITASGNTGTTSGPTLTVGSGTATEGKQLAITYLGPNTGVPSAGSGWNSRSTYLNNLVQDRLTTAAGETITGTANLPSGNNWYGVFAIFKCRP